MLSLTTKGSLSFPFNDYSNLLNQGFERNPCSSQCCSCCSCCCSCCASSFNVHRLPIHPSSFFGLRQSTLIQCSPSRRFILGGRNRYYYRLPAYGLDHGYYEVSCSSERKSGSERIERRGKERGRFRNINSREGRCLGGVDDMEAVISLLSEEFSEEYIGDDDRNGVVYKRVEIEERGNYGSKCHKGRKRNSNVKLGLLESDCKSEFKSGTGESMKEECSRNEDQEREDTRALSRKASSKRRAASSSFSSYYSLSSTGDLESDEESKEEEGDVLGESSTVHNMGLRRTDDRLDRQVVEERKEHRDRAERREVSGQKTSATRTGVEWDLRKKSEKKLAEIEENKSRKESSQMHSRMVGTQESDYMKASSSDTQTDKWEEETLAVNLRQGARKQYSQLDNQVKEQSEFRRNYQEITDMQEIQGRNVETTSQHQKKLNGREEQLMMGTDLALKRRDEHHRMVDGSAGEGNLQRNTQKLIDISETESVRTKVASNLQRHSESRMKIREEDRVRSSFQETNVQRHQRGEHVTEQTDSRSSQMVSEISENSTINKSSKFQAECRTKNLEETASVVYGSGAEAKQQSAQTDLKALQEIDRQRSQDVTNIALNVTNVSLVQASNTKTINNNYRTSQKNMVDQRSELTSFAKPIQETRERDHQTVDADQVQLRDEARVSGKASSFPERTSQGSRTPLDRVSLVNVHQSYVEEGNLKTQQETMKPPPPQLVTRDSMHIDPTSGTASEVLYTETSEGSSSAYDSGGRTPTSQKQTYGSDRKGEFFGEPLDFFPEDTLASARRLEESSKQFVGEFVEKARHEASTSELQKESGVSDTKLAYKGEKSRPKSSGLDSGNVQLKDQDSRHSPGGSGVKGPSDEMWHVTDPSLQEPPEKEASEDGTDTKGIVAKRTGRSLWSVIGNIVRMRWGSHEETPKAARKSGGKSSSNESVSSEAWFSGHEPDETSDENVKRRKKSMSKEATPSHQLLKTSSYGQTETSDRTDSEDIIRQLEVDTSSPSVIIRSGSTSKHTSSPSDGQNFVLNQGGNISQVVTSGVEAGEPLASRHNAIMEETSGTVRADVSVSGSTELMEQSHTAELAEGSISEGKDVVLRQKRLQRNKQVLRDKFDEWEEAYIHESEQRKIDEMFMREALLEAKKAADTWEVPVGAVLVQHGKIIARGYNLVEELRDSTAHAEMICIREASNQLRTWRLAETTLYVTLEPCPMCAGAILQARVDTLVWGAPNKLLGADGSWIRLFPNGEGGNNSELADKPPAPVHPFHPNMKIRRGILASECADAMQQFFQLRRRKKKEEVSPPRPSCLPITNPQPKILRKMHDIFHVMFCL